MKPTYIIAFTKEEWEEIRDAVAARADSLCNARSIISEIEIQLPDME